MNKADRELLRAHTAVRHQRFGNEIAWSVRGGSMKRGQIVHTHAMCGEVTAIKKAIAQDNDEQTAQWFKQEADKTKHWPNNQNTGGSENERG